VPHNLARLGPIKWPIELTLRLTPHASRLVLPPKNGQGIGVGRSSAAVRDPLLPFAAPESRYRIHAESGHPLAGLGQGQNQSSALSVRPFQGSPARTTVTACSPNRARFLALSAANRIAPDTHRDQAGRTALRPPWRRAPPQRNVGAKPCPWGSHCVWLWP
jgi:hypothetical protein